VQELGYDTVEFNASDTRSKKLLHEHVANMLSTTSVSSLFHHTDKVGAPVPQLSKYTKCQKCKGRYIRNYPLFSG
jgi:hypothetical protein